MHLVSPFAVRLLEAYPDLFAGPAIIPAFREDKPDLMGYVAAAGTQVDQGLLREHISRLEESIKKVMPWTLGEQGIAYRDLVVNGLRSQKSLIAQELTRRGIDASEVERVAAEINGLDFENSGNLRAYVSHLPEKMSEPLKRFTAACYHKVGAGVVGCEVGTDLSPLSEFKAADVFLAARDERPEMLSDEAVFFGGISRIRA